MALCSLERRRLHGDLIEKLNREERIDSSKFLYWYRPYVTSGSLSVRFKSLAITKKCLRSAKDERAPTSRCGVDICRELSVFYFRPAYR